MALGKKKQVEWMLCLLIPKVTLFLICACYYVNRRPCKWETTGNDSHKTYI